MFLKELSSRQQHALMSLARDIILADGKIDPREQMILDRFKTEAGIEPVALLMISFEDAILCFQDGPQRRAAMLELVAVCWCDGEMADSEALLLDRIADGWLIGAVEKSRMIDWVRRQTALYREACDMITVAD